MVLFLRWQKRCYSSSIKIFNKTYNTLEKNVFIKVVHAYLDNIFTGLGKTLMKQLVQFYRYQHVQEVTLAATGKVHTNLLRYPERFIFIKRLRKSIDLQYLS